MDILIVDDEQVLLFGLEKALKMSDISVHTAKNASEALNLIKKNNYKIIITDINMPPGMDGFELLDEIKDLNIKKIIMSGYLENKNRLKEYPEVIKFYSKPFDLFSFIDYIKEQLNE